MTRRSLREQVFKLLFRVEFNNAEEMEEQKGLFFETLDEMVSEDEAKIVKDRYDLVVSHLDEIDEKINEVAKGWTTKRMGKVDLTLIRLGLFEMLYDEDVPNEVAINEAVELAKTFGQDESYSFVNAILAKFLKHK